MRLALYRTPRDLGAPWWGVLIIGGWLALVGAHAWLAARTGHEVVLCLFKRITGYPCPTCGSTRAVLALLAGQPLHALSYNPLVLLLLIVCALLLVLRLGLGRGVRIFASPREWTVLWIGGVALALLNWAFVLWSFPSAPFIKE